MCNSAPSPMRRLGALVHPPCAQGPSDWKRSSMDTQEPTPQEEAFMLGEPALVCRWRMTARRVPLLNRHIRALGARRLNGEAVPRSLLSWAKQHIEWSLADDTTVAVPDDGVLMLVIDKAGHAAMSTGAYEPLANTAAEALAYRALGARREADETGVAPQVLACAADGALVLGVSEDDALAGTASLALQLAETRGLRVERDPALAYRTLSGACPGALALLSDEHGVVIATDAALAGEESAFIEMLAQGYDKLRA